MYEEEEEEEDVENENGLWFGSPSLGSLEGIVDDSSSSSSCSSSSMNRSRDFSERNGSSGQEKKSTAFSSSSFGGGSGSTISASGSAGVSSTKSNTIEEWKRITTFMEYDTSKNYKFHTDKADEEEQNAVLTPTYPLTSSHVLAHMFMQPPKYRCRGRIGRGGRLIIDRIPVVASRFYGPSEIQATTSLLNNKPKTNVVGLIPQAPGVITIQASQHHSSIAQAIEANHAAMLVNESSFRPAPPKAQSIDGHVIVPSSRLQEIYSMSDSEDEWLEPMTAAIIETKTKKEDRGRSVKFALNI
jgi:enhancer of polycomb-like protein